MYYAQNFGFVRFFITKFVKKKIGIGLYWFLHYSIDVYMFVHGLVGGERRRQRGTEEGHSCFINTVTDICTYGFGKERRLVEHDSSKTPEHYLLQQETRVLHCWDSHLIAY